MENIGVKIKKVQKRLEESKKRSKKINSTIKKILAEKYSLVEEVRIIKNKIVIKAKNKSAANELFFTRAKLESLLNEEIGADFEIRFI